MTTPHELLSLAADDLAAANKVWAEGRTDPNALGEITMRIQIATAQAILAIGELLHEHFHYHPPAALPQDPSAPLVDEDFAKQVSSRVHGTPVLLEGDEEH